MLLRAAQAELRNRTEAKANKTLTVRSVAMLAQGQGLRECSAGARTGTPLARHVAQVQPLQEGHLDVPLEVEEEAHSPLAEEAQEDEAALQVMKTAS